MSLLFILKNFAICHICFRLLENTDITPFLNHIFLPSFLEVITILSVCNTFCPHFCSFLCKCASWKYVVLCVFKIYMNVLYLYIRGLSGKCPTIVNITKQCVQHRCNLAAKESGLECACMNNDNFTVLVSRGNRRCWVSMCTVWPLHSKWLSK